MSLILDLFAFTIPLPLFPRIIEWYTLRESSNPHGFLSLTLRSVTAVRSLFFESEGRSKRWDIVLLGGLMGSVFSTLQFYVSPKIGALSDKYGRKPILLLTMVGNMLSALVWVKSTTFASYMLSRVIGGLSEANVQLALSILSDVTTPDTRSKTLALIGIAFSICFCIGPPIGAYFASKPLPASWNRWGIELNIYAAPAVLTLLLLAAETGFLIFALPETRGKASTRQTGTPTAKVAKAGEEETISGTTSAPARKKRIALLKTLGRLNFCFLALFSGVEFTFTFLTFDLFDWTNTQNGKLIGSIGVISALLQAGYVRRSMTKVGEGNMARRGVLSCAFALIMLALLPRYVEASPSTAIKLLQAAAVCIAFTSATVVNSLTALASLQCEESRMDEATGKVIEEHPELAKGKALGTFRSSGQLGRALGPLLACASYWTFGPSVTYGTSAVAMLMLSMTMSESTRS